MSVMVGGIGITKPHVLEVSRGFVGLSIHQTISSTILFVFSLPR